MNLISNKKEKKTDQSIKPAQKPKVRKTIGLEEQVAEARRLFLLLENPELLKQQFK